jgi:hypothetical protein
VQPLKREAMWLPLERPARQAARSNPEPAALASRFVEPLHGEEPTALARLVLPKPASVARAVPVSHRPGPTGAQPMAMTQPKARGRSINALISALAVVALVPLALLFVQLWQDMMRPPSVTLPVTARPTAVPPPLQESVYPKKHTARLEAGADDGEEILPPAVAVTDHIPGTEGWGLSPAETGALPLWATAQTGSPAISAAPPSEAAPAAMDVAGAVESRRAEEIAQAERPKPVPGAVPLPQRKPGASAGTEPLVQTVKVVTIPAPNPARPHDGAYALGSPAETQAAAEWMVTKTAVDMHAKAEQSSETVKVAEGGVKMRVMARDKRWIQVSDPASSTTGWIYDRFLEPADAPAQ